jgi:ribosomal protein L29
MSDEDATRANLEVRADLLRSRLLHDVDELAHAPIVEKAREVRRTVARVAPIALGVIVGLTALTLFFVVRRVVRAFAD